MEYYDKLGKILVSRSATHLSSCFIIDTVTGIITYKEPSSHETDLRDLEDDHSNNHSNTSAAYGGISDNLDDSKPSGSATASLNGPPFWDRSHSDSQESENSDKKMIVESKERNEDG